MTWGDFLKYLSNPDGIKAGAAVAVVICGQFWPRWRGQPQKVRLLAIAAVCFALPLLAAGLGVWTENWSPLYQSTFWPALEAGALSLVPAAIAEGLDLGGKAKEQVGKRKTQVNI